MWPQRAIMVGVAVDNELDNDDGAVPRRRLEWSQASGVAPQPWRATGDEVVLTRPTLVVPVDETAEPDDDAAVPAGAAPTIRRRGRVRRIAMWVLVGAAVVCGVPAVWLGWNLVRDTVEAGKGGETPDAIVVRYFMESPVGGQWAGTEVDYNVYGCGADEQLHRQATALVGQARRAEVAGRWVFDRVEPDASPRGIDIGRQEVAGARATVLTYARWSYSNVDPGRRAGDALVFGSAAQPWQFELARDSQGWRVCAVIAPDPCAPESQLRCDPPASAGPAATASTGAGAPNSPQASAPAKVWDARVRWQCLPDTPSYFRRTDCGSPSADWSAPGPYECAPDYPLIRGSDTVAMCRRLGWQVS